MPSDPDASRRVRGSRRNSSGFRSLAAPPLAPTPSLREGTLIAERFDVLGKLGEGGMGEVYLAEQIAIGRHVALKLVRPSLASDEAALERFRREALAASRIRSPHVVTVYDFGRDAASGRLFLAMELLEGETLAERIERVGALPTGEAVDVALAIAQALEAAHRAGVIHRDLKPENVVMEDDGGVKVLDFGIARLLDPGSEATDKHLTNAAMIIGTPAYISPEAGARRTVVPASDLYSLGVMLFEMLVGRPPFDDPEPIVLVGLHLRAPPERVCEARGDDAIPPALDELVDRLLQKDPADRYASAREVAGALQDIAQNVATPASRPAKVELAERIGAPETRSGPPSGETAAAHESMDAGASYELAAGADPGTAETAVQALVASASATSEETTATGSTAGVTVTRADPSRISASAEPRGGSRGLVGPKPDLERGHAVAREDEPVALPAMTTARSWRSRLVLAVGAAVMLAAVPVVLVIALTSDHGVEGEAPETTGEVAPIAVPERHTRVGPSPSTRPMSPDELATEPEQAPPPSIDVVIDALPRSAIIELDGRRMTGREISMPADGSMHELSAFAPGYVPQRTRFAAIADRTITLRLRRQAPRHAPRRAPSPDTARGRRRHATGERTVSVPRQENSSPPSGLRPLEWRGP